MRLAWSMANMAKGGCLHATVEETQFLVKKPQAEVQREEKRRVEFPGHTDVKAGMKIQQAMHWEKQTYGCLLCQYDTAQTPQKCWRCEGTGAPPRERLRQQTPEPTPHPPETPPVPPGDNEAVRICEIEGVPPGYVCIHTPLPSDQFFNLNTSTKDHKRNKNSNADLLTNEGTTTG